MKNNENMERFFKDIASQYVEREGCKLRRELSEQEAKDNPSLRGLDLKVKRGISRTKPKKMYYAALPAAAAILLFFVYSLSGPPISETPSEAGSAPSEIILLSAKLPEDYSIEEIDYDQTQTIYYLANETNNQIILTMEQNGVFEKSGFQEILINGTEAYVMVKKDYSFLAYESEGILYTLTSPYDYRDLLELTKSLL